MHSAGRADKQSDKTNEREEGDERVQTSENNQDSHKVASKTDTVHEGKPDFKVKQEVIKRVMQSKDTLNKKTRHTDNKCLTTGQ